MPMSFTISTSHCPTLMNSPSLLHFTLLDILVFLLFSISPSWMSSGCSLDLVFLISFSVFFSVSSSLLLNLLLDVRLYLSFLMFFFFWMSAQFLFLDILLDILLTIPFSISTSQSPPQYSSSFPLLVLPFLMSFWFLLLDILPNARFLMFFPMDS